MPQVGRKASTTAIHLLWCRTTGDGEEYRVWEELQAGEFDRLPRSVVDRASSLCKNGGYSDAIVCIVNELLRPILSETKPRAAMYRSARIWASGFAAGYGRGEQAEMADLALNEVMAGYDDIFPRGLSRSVCALCNANRAAKQHNGWPTCYPCANSSPPSNRR